jgi:hypothetical protein
MIGLLSDGEAVYTDSAKSIEAQKQDAMRWLDHYDLTSVHAVVGSAISDITAAYCRMWINNADLDDYGSEAAFPDLIRNTVPELVAEVLADRADAERAYRDLRADYRASAL